MALPQPDPSLPGGAAPVFGDTDAARGDHLRANNQAIWENLQYLGDGKNINDASAATPVDADKVGFFQIVGGIIKYVTCANFFAYVVSKLIAVTAKTTPVNADAVLLRDSEASDAPKWLTFTNLKAFLKTYFDTLYAPVTTIITAPVAWTPTFTGFGTVSNINAYSWRVGPLLFFEIYFTSGTPTGVEARISLGFNGVNGSVTTSSTYAALQMVGFGGGSNSAVGIYCLAEASQTYLTFGRLEGTGAFPLSKNNGTAFVVASGNYSLKGSVKIQGW